MNKNTTHKEHGARKKRKFPIGWIAVVLIITGIIYLAASAPKIPSGEYVAMDGLHAHAHLSIVINGAPVTLPPGLGLSPVENPIHVHENDDIIHMEFAGKVKKDDLRLKNFFNVWGKDFSQYSILGNKAGNGHTIVMKVNGATSTEYENYVMHDKDSIEITYQ